MRVRLALLLLSVVPSVAGAGNIHVNDASTAGDLVDPTGATWCASSVPGQDTATCGTCAAPCASIRGALISNVLAPGDTVFINTGTYEARKGSDYAEVVTSGQPGAPITFHGAVDANGTPLAVLNGASLAYTCMWIRDASNIVVRGLECGATAPPPNPCNPPYGSGFLVSGTSTNVVFDGVWAHTGFNSQCNAAIDLFGGGTTTGLLEIRNSRAFDSGEGIAVRIDAPVRVTDNVVARNHRHGIFLYDSTVNAARIISNNDVYENARGGGNFAGITVRSVADTVLSSNRVHSNGHIGIRISCSVDSKNACSAPARRASIHGNTVHDNLRLTATNGSEIRVDNCGTEPVSVQDNILVATQSGGLGALVVTAACAPVTWSDYNDLYTTTASGTLVHWGGTAYGTLSNYQTATSRDQHSISVDPLFVDGANPTVAARNLRLRSQAGHWTFAAWAQDATATSPAIDAAAPTSAVGDETFCHGGRRNLGAYGGSATASRSYQKCGLVFATPPQTLQPQQCSLAVTVSTQDTSATAGTVSSPVTVSLTSSSTTLTFFSDPGCSTPVTQAGIPAGANATTFYFHDTTVGAPTMTASAANLQPASQSHQIQLQATALAFTTSPQVVAAGGCSAKATVQTRNAQGAPAAVGSPTPISLTSPSGTLAFFSDAACSNPITQSVIPVGADTASFYFRDTAAGTATITAASPGMTSVMQAQTVLPAQATSIAIVTPPQTIRARDCSSPVQVQTQDAYGNRSPVSAEVTLALAASSATAAFFVDPGCLTPTTTAVVPTGAAEVSFYFSDATPGSVALTVTGLGAVTQTQTVTPGAATALRVSTSHDSFVAGAGESLLTVTAVDDHGTVIAMFEGPITLTARTADGAGGTLTPDTPQVAVNGTTTWRFTSTQAGTFVFTAAAAGVTDGSGSIVVHAASPHHVRTTAGVDRALAGEAIPLSLQVVDAHGNAAPLQTALNLTAVGDSCELSPAALQTAPSGAASSTLRCLSSGRVQVCATADTLTGAPECAQLDVELPETSLRVTLTTSDSDAGLVPGGRVTFQVTLTNASDFHAEGLILRLSTEGVVLDEDPSKMVLPHFEPGQSMELGGSGFVSAAPGQQHAVVNAWLERRDAPASARAELRFDVQPLQSDMGCGCGATSSPAAAWGALLLLCALRAARRKRGQATFREK